MARRKKKQTFSVAKAVKLNARERIGSPPATRTIDPDQKQAAKKRKHIANLAELLEAEENAG